MERIFELSYDLNTCWSVRTEVGANRIAYVTDS